MQPTDTSDEKKQKARERTKLWQAAHPDYQRKRREAIANGTWAYRHKPDTLPSESEPPGAAE